MTVPAFSGYLIAGSINPFLLIPFGFLSATSYTAASEGTVWPVAQAILPPELRGSSRAIINMVAGGIGALLLALSAVLVDQYGINRTLILLTPLPILIGLLAWLPILRTYGPDREALHVLLTRRRLELDAQG